MGTQGCATSWSYQISQTSDRRYEYAKRGSNVQGRRCAREEMGKGIEMCEGSDVQGKQCAREAMCKGSNVHGKQYVRD